MALRVPYLYAIGGKSQIEGGMSVKQKTIERYDIERDEWVELRM